MRGAIETASSGVKISNQERAMSLACRLSTGRIFLVCVEMSLSLAILAQTATMSRSRPK